MSKQNLHRFAQVITEKDDIKPCPLCQGPLREKVDIIGKEITLSSSALINYSYCEKCETYIMS